MPYIFLACLSSRYFFLFVVLSAQYFTEPFPARSCVEVARLPKDVLVECEVIAEA